jgi:hypothetical protein
VVLPGDGLARRGGRVLKIKREREKTRSMVATDRRGVAGRGYPYSLRTMQG